MASIILNVHLSGSFCFSGFYLRYPAALATALRPTAYLSGKPILLARSIRFLAFFLQLLDLNADPHWICWSVSPGNYPAYITHWFGGYLNPPKKFLTCFNAILFQLNLFILSLCGLLQIDQKVLKLVLFKSSDSIQLDFFEVDLQVWVALIGCLCGPHSLRSLARCSGPELETRGKLNAIEDV